MAPYLFIAPFFLLYGAFLLGPTIFSLWLSFHSWDGITPMEWVGGRNYTNLLDDPTFISSAKNTALYAVVALCILAPLALLLAVVLNARTVRAKDLFRAVYFLPIVLSPLVIAIIFILIFDKQFGLANAALRGLGLEPIAWLSTPLWAKAAVIAVIIWRYTGYVMIFFLAGLQNVPGELREAARVSGASQWQEFRYVTSPLLRPVTAFIAIIVLIGAAQIFEEPYILTGGGPADATISVAQFVYREGLTNLNMGYASAASVVLFVAIAFCTFVLVRVFRVGREL